MSRNKKIVAIVTLVLGFVLLTVGVSSALMNYNRIGSNHQVVLGDIWMSYEETTALTIEDALPGSDYSNYFEFTISGKNTYTKKDIYYDFSLVRGDLPEGKTEENRIPDKYLKFKLVSVDDSNQETVIFTDETYESLENQRIHVETIKKNTENKINRKYRLYMTIDNSLEIGNLETAVFTLDEWESAFASVKLNVTGDFSEKIVLSYDDCFKTNILDDGTLKITDYYKYGEYNYSTSTYYDNELCTSDVVIPSEINGVSVTKIESYAFCNNNLTSVEIPDSVTIIGYEAFSNNSLENVVIPDSVTEIGYNAFESNLLTSVEIPDSVVSIESAAFNNNKLPDSEATIYARTDNNSDGVAEIDTTTIVSYGGLNKNPVILNSVTKIDVAAFSENSLTSVEIPNSVITIENSAFSFNNLTSVTIPDSVTTIEAYAFANNNQIESVKLGNNLRTIGKAVFQWTRIKSVEIPSSVTHIGESAFEHNQITNVTFAENSKLIEIGTKAFLTNQIENLVIPDSVIFINSLAFGQNNLKTVTLGSSVRNISEGAFLTHGLSYAGSNMITNVVNKSGNSFNWSNIFGHESTDGNNTFATGNFNFYYNGDQTIEITDVDVDEGSGE